MKKTIKITTRPHEREPEDTELVSTQSSECEDTKPSTDYLDDDDYLDAEGAHGIDDVVDLDAINTQIDGWLTARAEQTWSENEFYDFVEELLKSGALDSNRDRLVAGVLKQWSDDGLKVRTLEKVWRTTETELLKGFGGGADTADRQRELGIVSPAPFRQPVDGDMLADAIEIELRRYITAADPYYAVMVLWVLHTHCLQHAWLDCTPRLVFKSPVKGCGKSTAMRTLRAMCPRSMMSTSMTGAVLFRIVEEVQPTLFIDEIDSSGVLVDIGHLLKSGYRRGEAFVHRCVPDEHDNLVTASFSVFAAVALAGIGNQLDAALQSRSLEIILHGRTASEARSSKRFKSSDLERLQNGILPMALRWATDAERDLTAVGAMPDHSIVNRDLDLWEPLWIIAQVLGGQWPTKLQTALDALTAAKEDPRNRRGDILLDVVRLANSEAAYRTDNGEPTQWQDLRFTAAELWRGLTSIDNGKWQEGQNGSRGLTVHQMERALSPFTPPGKMDGLSRRIDNPDTFRHIERTATAPRSVRVSATASKKRNRARAICMSDLFYAVDRYVKSDDITDT